MLNFAHHFHITECRGELNPADPGRPAGRAPFLIFINRITAHHYTRVMGFAYRYHTRSFFLFLSRCNTFQEYSSSPRHFLFLAVVTLFRTSIKIFDEGREEGWSACLQLQPPNPSITIATSVTTRAPDLNLTFILSSALRNCCNLWTGSFRRSS